MLITDDCTAAQLTCIVLLYHHIVSFGYSCGYIRCIWGEGLIGFTEFKGYWWVDKEAMSLPQIAWWFCVPRSNLLVTKTSKYSLGARADRMLLLALLVLVLRWLLDRDGGGLSAALVTMSSVMVGGFCSRSSINKLPST